MRKLMLTAMVAGAALLWTTTTALAKDEKQPPRKPTLVKRKPAPRAAKPAPAPVAATSISTDVNRTLTRPGDYRFAIQHGGLTRTYRVHVPARYEQTEPAPMLVALHGGGMDGLADDGFDSLTRESEYQGFIAVFPDGYDPPGKGLASWNAGHCCGEAPARKVNDVGFIEQVVINVFRQTSIDRQRIYAAGVSDGGMMAYRLACELPYVFRAVASVAGTDNTATCDSGRPVAVMHFHARNDPRVPFAGGAVDDGGGAKPLKLTSVPETVAKWARRNACEPAPRRTLDRAGAYCEAYSYCRLRTGVELCVTDTGGHSWPGAKSRRRGETPSQAIQATRSIWGFFSSH